MRLPRGMIQAQAFVSAGMEYLGPLARLDTPCSAEVAAVAVGLLAAAQVYIRGTKACRI